MRIDSAELLIWVQEQSEEKSINLTKFTEHFNNMSYWTRTLILQQPDAKVDNAGCPRKKCPFMDDKRPFFRDIWKKCFKKMSHCSTPKNLTIREQNSH